jgi:hypothetical protein
MRIDESVECRGVYVPGVTGPFRGSVVREQSTSASLAQISSSSTFFPFDSAVYGRPTVIKAHFLGYYSNHLQAAVQIHPKGARRAKRSDGHRKNVRSERKFPRLLFGTCQAPTANELTSFLERDHGLRFPSFLTICSASLWGFPRLHLPSGHGTLVPAGHV